MTNDNLPAQHTPKHLEEGAVFDPKHPAASAFAPVQPGAGVVADDVEERGQNDAGGEKATEAESTYSDQKEVLAEQHEAALQAAVAPVRRWGAAPRSDESKASDSGTKSAAAKKTAAAKPSQK